MCFKKLLLLLTVLVASEATETQNDMLVLGGVDTDITQRPFQAMILGGAKCGATIISHSTLLTAAHCLWYTPFRPMVAFVGTSYSFPDTPALPTQGFRRHEGYRSGNTYLGEPAIINDIGLVFLANPLTFFERVQAIALPPPDLVIPEGSVAFISGFGQISVHPITPMKLQSAEIHVKNATFCTNGGTMGRVDPTMICAGDTGRGACFGDSGGPLTSSAGVIGIVSWGLKCGGTYTSAVFTRVSSYRQWIDQHMRS